MPSLGGPEYPLSRGPPTPLLFKLQSLFVLVETTHHHEILRQGPRLRYSQLTSLYHARYLSRQTSPVLRSIVLAGRMNDGTAHLLMPLLGGFCVGWRLKPPDPQLFPDSAEAET